MITLRRKTKMITKYSTSYTEGCLYDLTFDLQLSNQHPSFYINIVNAILILWATLSCRLLLQIFRYLKAYLWYTYIIIIVIYYYHKCFCCCLHCAFCKEQQVEYLAFEYNRTACSINFGIYYSDCFALISKLERLSLIYCTIMSVTFIKTEWTLYNYAVFDILKYNIYHMNQRVMEEHFFTLLLLFKIACKWR